MLRGEYSNVDDGHGSSVAGSRGWNKRGWLVCLLIVVLVGFGGLFFSGVLKPRQVVVEDLDVPVYVGKLDSKIMEWGYGKLHVMLSKSNKTKTQVIALHGSDKETQNAGHWSPNMGMLSKIGNFCLVDAPGFGESENNRLLQSIPASVSGDAIQFLLDDMKLLDNEDTKIVFVARGWGVEALMIFLRNYPEHLNKQNFNYIFLSPTPLLMKWRRNLTKYFSKANGLIVWAERDPEIPNSYRKYLKNSMPLMDEKVIAGIETHYPETSFPGIVSKIVLDWWEKNE
ncbi:hypothetical protein NDN08_007399 [Rhodosorus marinus]|uniref:AB hydrolase-1 domain-containing protein n=1 Tax=Rhodosorus marinus TaxID=101924 RepID=A0AAV8UYZ8_9RHOD|nr:hypothetical protein NDN08_007399 [Rhodosorus marinus]